MRLVELSVEKFEEIRPYVDTLILPVCSIGGKEEGKSFAGDLILIRQIASRIDNQLSGRVFLLPEAVHTNLSGEPANMPEQILADYLFHLLLPFKEIGFDKAVLLHAAGTPGQPLAEASCKLTQEGFKVSVIRANLEESDLDDSVRQIIQLWNS
ncbi:DUF2487 family protein [Effusibacillus consociatus]|uniref:DUF2487 family protein n=1 Tax=Effusibacillus consociatus TaxID=1117041 RepID=A0ABV9Q6R9_9BACL